MKDKYLVQEGIQLQLPNGRVHDYRMLVQKNGEGEWELTGCAGRMGAEKSVTSNLHGGGQAVPMHRLMKQWITDEELRDEINATAEKLGISVASFLEDTYGDLCELALDLAIDKDGRIFLLEVNPKPAREVLHGLVSGISITKQLLSHWSMLYGCTATGQLVRRTR